MEEGFEVEASHKTESISNETENSSGMPIQSKLSLAYANVNYYTQKKGKSIHNTFLLLKAKLGVEGFMRKTQIDSLLKKCKSKVFKTIHEALKSCLTVKLPRLPQTFITNIKIDFNKIYLEKTIAEIYSEFNLFTNVSDFQEKQLIQVDKMGIFSDFLNMKLRDVFEFYLNSKQYVTDYYHILKREGEKFAILFNYISRVFIQYYTKSKGNKLKSKKDAGLNGNDGRKVVERRLKRANKVNFGVQKGRIFEITKIQRK